MATTITLKNIPSDLYDRIKESAARHHRSVNSEIIALMEERLFAKKMNPEDYLASARILREKTVRYELKKAFIDRAKREGRA